MDRPKVHLPSVVARLGETEYPEAYGGLTVRLSARKAITMTIYVVAARAGPFLAAVREQSARSPDSQCAIVHVPHTWAELNLRRPILGPICTVGRLGQVISR